MPVQIFQAEQVNYASAPFTNVRLAYNSAAECLNMVLPSSKRGAIVLGRGSHWEVTMDGRTVRVNGIVTVSFACEEQAVAFAHCFAHGSNVVAPAPATPPRGVKAKLEGDEEAVKPKRRHLLKSHSEAKIDDYLNDLITAVPASGAVVTTETRRETGVERIEGVDAPALDAAQIAASVKGTRSASPKRRRTTFDFLQEQRQKTTRVAASLALAPNDVVKPDGLALYQQESISAEVDIPLATNAELEKEATIFEFVKRVSKPALAVFDDFSQSR